MPDSNSERFRAFLAAKGVRLTRGRAIIAEIAFTMQRPIDPEELLSAVQVRSDSRISRATVYRTLAVLHDAGLA